MRNRIKVIFSNANSLLIAACFIAGSIYLVLWQPNIPGLIELQRKTGYKQLTGYTLVVLFVFMWMTHLIRKYFSDHKQREVIRIVHQWFGAMMIFVLVLHASLIKTGFLTILMWLLFVNALTGVVIGWGQLTYRPNLRRWVLFIHICLSFVTSGLAVLHLYFIYAYAS